MMHEQLDMFSMLEGETLLAAIAKRGSCFAGGKQRIINEWRTNHDLKSLAAFLKKEYGIGGYSFDYKQMRGFVDYNGSGICFREWKSETRTSFTYRQLAEEIARQIADGLYKGE